ncbi:protein MIZU-KUSSEI 1-like [Tripterygium wilfordii]|uniref:Protein MIZU-KUSSEI 1-like n=1 Tax=Tripterygium wilfordii TaxID=458696 RepID=A0A7J7DUE2_TRIWF|nr:protein MIZU-KUSSEI 1 [Tripterygium wilfordii]KAF5749927.1 protein MIZU-KUSSEI 1-like [Tripterygium wilfordii]
MGESKPNNATPPETPTSSTPSLSLSSAEPPKPPTPPPPRSLIQPSHKKKSKTKVFRVFRSVFRSFPIITPACKIPTLHGGGISLPDSRSNGITGTRVTGTLFGYRKGRVSLSMQENPKCLPSLVVELAMQTNALQKEMSAGTVRIALECEKRAEKDKTKLLNEPLWTMFCNGKKAGYGVTREATEEDLNVMELLKAVSMGAGVLPGNSDIDGPDLEIVYVRAHFERVVGSKDSETLYMLSPEGNNGPELSIFFVRI